MTAGVKYQLIVDDPICRGLAWLVYGGDDGSVLVFQPWPKNGRPVWRQLLQTRNKANGYWCVSLSRIRGKPKRPYTHGIILRAFGWPKPGTGYVAMHGDNEPDNNQPSNLKWGTMNENQAMRKEHSKINEDIRRELVDARICMTCSVKSTPKKRKYIWSGKITSADGKVADTTGQLPEHVASELTYLFRKMKKGVFKLPGQKVPISDMPAKDKVSFQMEEELILGQLIQKPKGFIVDEIVKWPERPGGYFPKVMHGASRITSGTVE